MKLPSINSYSDTISMISQFGGLNKNLQINEYEFADMTNITNDYYPVLANRMRRGLIRTLTNPQGFLGGNKLCYVDNNYLYYDDNKVKVTLDATDAKRQLVMMGAYLCVFPDGIVYNTNDNTKKNIRNEKVITTTVKMTLSKLDGTEFTSSNTKTQTTAPSDTSYYWIDTSQTDAVLKMYNENTRSWVSVGTTYVKISGTGIGSGFKAYDSVRFSGLDEIGYNEIKFNYDNSGGACIVYDQGSNYLVITGFIPAGSHTNTTESVTVTRYLPEMDFVCEMNNRIFGCSSVNHEIYACKQGDPTNWEFYGGLDSDSYAATIGTHGDFTGIASYGGYVYFFKEDGYHKLYGTKPSNFEMIWKAGRGVQMYSDKSIAVINDRLYLKSRDAVCVYDGSMNPISTNLGVGTYYNAVAGSYRDKYYISMSDDKTDMHRLYVYDTVKGLWTIEDDIEAIYMANTSNGLYMVTSDNELLLVNAENAYSKIYPNMTEADYKYPHDSTIESDYPDLYPGNFSEAQTEDQIEWMFETGDIGMDSPYHKYLKRIDIRLWLDYRTKLKIEIMYDSSDEWQPIMEYFATKKRSYEVPMIIRRCDHCRLRFSGFGDFKLYSIAKVIEVGSGI